MNGDSIFEKVKTTVKISEVVEHFGVHLDRNDKALCPFHNEDTPSFSVKREDNIYKCFGCGESGDAVDFVAKIKGIEPLEAAKQLAEIYGIDAHPQSSRKGVDKIHAAECKRQRDAPQRVTAQIKEYLNECVAAVGRTNYFKGRGLTDETIRKFYLGFDEKKQAVVLPYSSKLEYYQTRSIADKKFFKPRTEDAGAEPIYNAEAIGKTKGAVFVVESPICALSIMQSGGAAIATCGTSGINKFVAEIKTRKPQCFFVLCLDNDDAGRKAQQDLANVLFEQNAKFITYNIAGKYKDPNELLMADTKALSANISAATQTARREFSTLKRLFSASELQTRELRPIRWIVRDILPEGLAIICAPSKYGKSWMMLQLCVAVTQGKPFLERQTEQSDCVYFSLEDSERRFKSRLIKLMNGSKAPSNFYGSVECKAMGNGLFEQLTELIEAYPKIGLIIIDTFQKIRTGQQRNESLYGADYREMGEVKSFADKHGICVLLVHHLRKQDDDSDIFNRINGSMAIMGASDTSWILSRKKRGDTNTTLTLTGRDIEDMELVVSFDKNTVKWELIGNAEDEAARLARAEYESNPVIKTVKALIEKNPSGWRGTSSEIKVKIYEETGVLYTKSPETIGRAIRNYADRLLADGITHSDERGKRHLFAKKQTTLFNYDGRDDD